MPEIGAADGVAVVVTTINPPTPAMVALAAGCVARGAELIVIGDRKSPRDFALPGARWFDLATQGTTGFSFAETCPVGHYARKNIGYLVAMAGGARCIVETDDDNAPAEGFWETRRMTWRARGLRSGQWVNAYAFFSDLTIWPRGLPLDRVHDTPRDYSALAEAETLCPIQQGLADGNPDVDAVYRLVLPLPVIFARGRAVALGPGTWCPFNSQNTTFFPCAYELLYLPFHCSFRMTDIWRSFVAQAIAHLNGWSVLFHEATVVQDRNEHDLMRDFADEVPGYLHNDAIRTALLGLGLAPGADAIPDNLRRCYARLIEMGLVGAAETDLLERWLADVGALRAEGLIAA